MPPSLSPNVELVIAFTNSEDHELQTDDLATRAGLSAWLHDRGLLGRRSAATDDDLELAHRLRAGLHAALVANHDGTADAAPLAAAAADLPLRFAVAEGRPTLEPARDGVPGALSRVLVAVNEAVADGSWPRLKICAADDCRWAYFDSTKNRSRAWCEWGCGNKAKTRRYRERRRAADG